MLSEYLRIGQVLRPQGIGGAVKVRPETDDAARFLRLKHVCIQTKDVCKTVVVEDISVRDRYVFLRLDGASSREEAEAQRGLPLFVLREEAVELPDGRYFISELIGCAVRGKSGEDLGAILEVLQPGANDVYVIATARGRMLLPAIARVVLKVDIPLQTVTIDETTLDEVAVFED